MVSAEEAWKIISDQRIQIKPQEIAITDAVGRVLAQGIVTDRDFPQFDRVTMDGIAIEFGQLARGQRSFMIEGVQAAGEAQKKLGDISKAIEVMTGAVLPEGTDTVIRYEDLEIKENLAYLSGDGLKKGANIHRQGTDAKAGSTLLDPGVVITPAEVAIMASVGLHKVKVKGYPRTALISTGDELVNGEQNPERHQVRSSNTYALQAAMKPLGWEVDVYSLTDNEKLIRQSLEVILSEHELLILSGGVSKGRFDFIPSALESLGVKKLFHQVAQRPGKPLWFGIQGEEKVVFALPGNPVSTYLCFYRYVKPWLLAAFGVEPPRQTAVLDEDFHFEGALTYFLQVRLRNEDGVLKASPRPGGGSGDFANLKEADGFLELPPTQASFPKGSVFPLILFRN